MHFKHGLLVRAADTQRLTQREPHGVLKDPQSEPG